MNFFDLSLFIAILLAYVLWSVIRVHKKAQRLVNGKAGIRVDSMVGR
jgi:hypothetical protein